MSIPVRAVQSYPDLVRIVTARLTRSKESLCTPLSLKMLHLWTIFLFLPLIKAQNGFYTVVAPKTIRPNLPYNVGVSIDASSPVTVVVSLKATLSTGGSSTSTQQSVIEPGSSQLITLQ
ncbi:unnamed protein product, partial [Allacma fusca]